MTNPAQIIRSVQNDPSIIKTSTQAKTLHAHIIKINGGGCNYCDYIALLLSIYSNLNLLQECQSIFSSFYSTPPTKAWKSIIKGCAYTGNFRESIVYFNRMRASGRIPGRNVYPSMLKTSVHLKDLKFGEVVHGCIVRVELDNDIFTGNALMNIYAKLESFNIENLFDSEFQTKGLLGFEKDVNFVGGRKKRDFLDGGVTKVFEDIPIIDVVSWNTTIGGYIQNGMYEEALLSVRKMADENLKLDSFTLSSVLPIFAKHVDVMIQSIAFLNPQLLVNYNQIPF